MNDFSRQIAVDEEFPSIFFGLESLDTTVLIHDLPAPECVKLTVVGRVHSVFICFCFSHGDVTFRLKASTFFIKLPTADLNETAYKEMTPEGGDTAGVSLGWTLGLGAEEYVQLVNLNRFDLQLDNAHCRASPSPAMQKTGQ
jgi:hypothetical protein